MNELMINGNNLSVQTIKTIETTIETLKTIEDCANHKDEEVGRNSFDEFRKLINEIEKKCDLIGNLFKMNIRLNVILCEGCKRKGIRKLADKCGNEEIAKFLYKCRLNREQYCSNYIRWIPFDEFKNIEYLTKGGFGEVHKTTWIDCYDEDEMEYYDQEVV